MAIKAPLHALQGFVIAARAGNLTHAAEAMHVTVSALSHQVRLLEQRLDRRLFDRGARGVSLTADGQLLLERVASHLDALEAALQPFAARCGDVLTLSVTPSMASAWLVPRLGSFLASYPGVEINLLSNGTLVDFARATDVDAALRIGKGEWPGVVSEPLFDEWVAPVASPALIARMGKLSPDRLDRWPWLGDPRHDDHWSEWFARFGGHLPERFAANFDDSEALHRAAVAGVGVALGRLTRVRLLLESGQLQRLGEQRLKAEYAHFLVYPPRSQSHSGLLAFRTWLHEEARRYANDMETPPLPPSPVTPGARRKRQ